MSQGSDFAQWPPVDIFVQCLARMSHKGCCVLFASHQIPWALIWGGTLITPGQSLRNSQSPTRSPVDLPALVRVWSPCSPLALLGPSPVPVGCWVLPGSHCMCSPGRWWCPGRCVCLWGGVWGRCGQLSSHLGPLHCPGGQEGAWAGRVPRGAWQSEAPLHKHLRLLFHLSVYLWKTTRSHLCLQFSSSPTGFILVLSRCMFLTPFSHSEKTGSRYPR